MLWVAAFNAALLISCEHTSTHSRNYIILYSMVWDRITTLATKDVFWCFVIDANLQPRLVQASHKGPGASRAGSRRNRLLAGLSFPSLPSKTAISFSWSFAWGCECVAQGLGKNWFFILYFDLYAAVFVLILRPVRVQDRTSQMVGRLDGCLL